MRPQNKEELFNLRHSQARNIIERCYGVAKKRIPALKNMPAYPYVIQIGFVLSCVILHNFIRIHQSLPDQYDNWDEDEEENDENIPQNNDPPNVDTVDWRENIAQAMWNDYNNYLATRS